MLPTLAFSIPQAARIALPALLLLGLVLYLADPPDGPGAMRGFVGAQDGPDAVLADGLDRDHDGAAVREACAARNWTEGIIFGCEAYSGNMAQVRNGHLTCVRLAIEAGAELILPRIVRRPDSDLAKTKPDAKGSIKGEPMSFFFDEDFAVSALERWCPQLRVHRSLDDLYAQPTLLNPLRFSVADLAGVTAEPETFARRFAAWLDGVSPVAARRPPVRVEMAEATAFWPLRADTRDFAREFGALLRIRPDARALAAAVLSNMERRFGLELDRHRGPRPDTFLGIDLRTANDAAAQGFPDYAAQAASYLSHLTASGLAVAYLSVAATSRDAAAFRKRAAEFNATVVQATDLLSTADRRAAWAPFTWDQRFLVDYEVLRRAGRFAGPSRGVFAWDVAVRRHFAWNRSAAELPAGPGTENVQFRDDLSILYGKPDEGDQFGATTWP